MDWWNSFETVSRIQTGLAVLLVAIGFVTLTFKLRGDQLKKTSDARRTGEQVQLTRDLEHELELKTTMVQSLAARLDQLEEEDRIRGLRRHFPKEKAAEFLKILGQGLTGQTPFTLSYVQSVDSEARNFASEIAAIFGVDPSSIATVADTTEHITGILVQDNFEGQAPSRFASNMVKAFETFGFKCTYAKGPQKPGIVGVVIGVKE